MIYVECKPDQLLITKLGFPEKSVRHAGNKSELCKILEKSENSVGVMDEDPKSHQPVLIQKSKLVAELSDLGLKKLQFKNNYIILLCPRFEEWLIERAKSLGYDLSYYDLPEDPEKLHRVINSNLKQLEKLLDDFRETKVAMELKKLIRYQKFF